MLDDGRARLEVVLEPERVEHDLHHTLGHLVDGAKYPGFRPGKVPPAVVLQRMGREEVFEETMREHLPSWVGEAIAGTRLHPADRPSVDFEAVPAEGESFTFSAADIHRVRHGGSDPAVTLHVYSPPLARMGAYEIDGDGVLARRPMASSEELRAA